MKDWEDNRGKNLKVQKVFWRNCLVRYIMYDCDVAKVQLALYHFEALKAFKCLFESLVYLKHETKNQIHVNETTT